MTDEELRDGIQNILRRDRSSGTLEFYLAQLAIDTNDILALIKQNYVRLAKDQRLPLAGPYQVAVAQTVRKARKDMLEVQEIEGKRYAFRKVELP